jgi:hypothetical protein
MKVTGVRCGTVCKQLARPSANVLFQAAAGECQATRAHPAQTRKMPEDLQIILRNSKSALQELACSLMKISQRAQRGSSSWRSPRFSASLVTESYCAGSESLDACARPTFVVSDRCLNVGPSVQRESLCRIACALMMSLVWKESRVGKHAAVNPRREIDTEPQRRLYPAEMRTFLAFVSFSILLCSCSTPPAPATKLEKAGILPLQLNDNFQFRKMKLFFLDADPDPITQSEPVIFERERIVWGALDRPQRERRYGNYFTFFWRTSERADVTVRLEYRQFALANHVMAKERYYPQAKGSYISEFSTTGDEYLEFGRVTSWRALLIVDGRIVALRQSFMWK